MLNGPSAINVERATFFISSSLVGKSTKRIASGELNLISPGWSVESDSIILTIRWRSQSGNSLEVQEVNT